jgi:hypothetical protein
LIKVKLSEKGVIVNAKKREWEAPERIAKIRVNLG